MNISKLKQIVTLVNPLYWAVVTTLVFPCFGEDYTGKEGPVSEISNVAGLKELVAKNSSIQNIETLIQSLPEPLLSSPTFVYRSESLQGASFDSPRVLLSDPSGNLVLAFNGEASQAGFDKIEIMEFNEPSARFTFYELGFSPQGKLEVSEPNPAKCLACHRGSDPRPNWESYDQWPGVYAGNDDRLRAEEVEPFKNFLSSYESRPRYSSLHLDHLKPVLKTTNHFGRLPGEPNISFTHRLSKNNFKRVARLISESRDYNQFKYFIAAFLNASHASFFDASYYLPDSMKEILKYFADSVVAEAQQLAVSYGNEASIPSTLAFRSIFESRGVDTSDWLMNFKGGFTSTWVNGLPWTHQMLQALLSKDPELNSMLMEGSTFQLDEGKLSEKSLQQFKDESHPEALVTYMNDPEVPQRIWRDSCLRCHEVSGPSQAPQISWRQAINHPKFKQFILNGEMPKNQKLTPAQKSKLIEFSTKESR